MNKAESTPEIVPCVCGNSFVHFNNVYQGGHRHLFVAECSHCHFIVPVVVSFVDIRPKVLIQAWNRAQQERHQKMRDPVAENQAIRARANAAMAVLQIENLLTVIQHNTLVPFTDGDRKLVADARAFIDHILKGGDSSGRFHD